MLKKAAKKTAAKKTVAKKTAAKKTAGSITPKRTMGPHDGPPLPDPLYPGGSGNKPAAAKSNAIDGYMNFPPPSAKPTPKK